jgi:Kef-type K+ transport system membrane component KefB
VHGSPLLVELGTVVLALGLLGALASRFGASPIPLYLLAGLASAAAACCRWRPASSSSPPAPRSG